MDAATVVGRWHWTRRLLVGAAALTVLVASLAVSSGPARAGTTTAQAVSDRLTAGQSMTGGQWLMSPDESHGLAFQADGNLVAYGPNSRVLWSSGTYGHPGAVFRLQADGNAVVYDAKGVVLWHAGTYGNIGATLRVQNDGNVVVYRADGTAAWYTGWDRTSLFPGDQLTAGQQVTSANGKFWLILQRDGNVVEYAPGGRPIWYSGSYGATRLVLQSDGNLVAYGANGAALFNIDYPPGLPYIHPAPATRLTVQDDGNAVAYDSTGAAAWFSGWDTGRPATYADQGYYRGWAPQGVMPSGLAPAVLLSCTPTNEPGVYQVVLQYTITGGVYDVGSSHHWYGEPLIVTSHRTVIPNGTTMTFPINGSLAVLNDPYNSGYLGVAAGSAFTMSTSQCS